MGSQSHNTEIDTGQDESENSGLGLQSSEFRFSILTLTKGRPLRVVFIRCDALDDCTPDIVSTVPDR
jgi:hypothetical protein